MKIVIVGAGEVGSHLAKLLSSEGQDVILVDSDESKLNDFEMYNLMTYTGKPTSFASLKEAGAGKCDLFIAVTPYETRNLLACSIAKNLGAKSAVARIDNYEYMKDFCAKNLPQFPIMELEGTYLAWMDCSALHISSISVEEMLLKKAKLWLNAGSMYGREGEGYMRWNLACPRQTLTTALERFATAITR